MPIDKAIDAIDGAINRRLVYEEEFQSAFFNEAFIRNEVRQPAAYQQPILFNVACLVSLGKQQKGLYWVTCHAEGNG
jgi:hypothetical protein